MVSYNVNVEMILHYYTLMHEQITFLTFYKIIFSFRNDSLD